MWRLEGVGWEWEDESWGNVRNIHHTEYASSQGREGGGGGERMKGREGRGDGGDRR